MPTTAACCAARGRADTFPGRGGVARWPRGIRGSSRAASARSARTRAASRRGEIDVGGQTAFGGGDLGEGQRLVAERDSDAAAWLQSVPRPALDEPNPTGARGRRPTGASPAPGAIAIEHASAAARSPRRARGRWRRRLPGSGIERLRSLSRPSSSQRSRNPKYAGGELLDEHYSGQPQPAIESATLRRPSRRRRRARARPRAGGTRAPLYGRWPGFREIVMAAEVALATRDGRAVRPRYRSGGRRRARPSACAPGADRPSAGVASDVARQP